MNQETRYHYEKRIKELQREIDRLRPWRETGLTIYDGVVEVIGKNNGISTAWILGKFRWLLK